MKKADLKNGDMLVMRSGHAALLIRNDSDILVYKNAGWEDLEDFDENLVYLYPDSASGEDAVMQIYRTDYGFGFNDFEEYSLIYERDRSWIRPTEVK